MNRSDMHEDAVGAAVALRRPRLMYVGLVIVLIAAAAISGGAWYLHERALGNRIVQSLPSARDIGNALLPIKGYRLVQQTSSKYPEAVCQSDAVMVGNDSECEWETPPPWRNRLVFMDISISVNDSAADVSFGVIAATPERTFDGLGDDSIEGNFTEDVMIPVPTGAQIAVRVRNVGITVDWAADGASQQQNLSTCESILRRIIARLPYQS